MKKIFYEKRGKRYVPVKEYDSDFLDAYPAGAHIVICKPGMTSRKFNIDPNYAALIAASYVAEDALAKALIKAGELRLSKLDKEKKLTPSQKAAWDNLIKEFGESARQLEWPSAREVAEEGMKSIQEEAKNLLENESVKKAYEHFILMSKLSKQNYE